MNCRDKGYEKHKKQTDKIANIFLGLAMLRKKEKQYE